MVGIWLVLSAVNGLERRPEYAAAIRSPEDLAGYLGTIENGQSFGRGDVILEGDRGVGTFGGSEDHTAILCSQPGELRRYSFDPVHYEGSAPFPAGHTLIIACSGVEATRTGPPGILQPDLARRPGAPAALE